MEEVLRIKPHHFVDIVTALGAGQEARQPHPYGHALHLVTGRILTDRDILLEMDLGADDICGPCIHNVGGRCDDTIDTSYRPAAPASKRAWNLRIDRRWCKRLGIASGDRLSARQFCVRLEERAGDIHDIYREMPAPMTAERQRKLEAGVRLLLDL